MQVIWKRLYNNNSSSDKGTLYQLRNVIRRTNVPCDPSNNVNAAEDFMNLVTKAHVLAAAMEFLQMDQLNGIPSPDLIPDESLLSSIEVRQQLLHSVSYYIVDKYVNIKENNLKNDDNIQAYASETLSLGLFHEEFHDAVKEGDGERVLRAGNFCF